MNKINLVFTGYIPGGLTKKQLNLILKKAVNVANFKRCGNINLAFVSQNKITQLNRQYAGINKPTDVLSFSYIEKPDNFFLDEIGDIAICTSIAKKQAKQNNSKLRDEIILLFVHGLLHIFGFDHQSKSQYARFTRLQSGIIKSVKS